jgi:hemoglobin
MCAFWSSVALMTGRYHGTPMAKHMPLPVDAGHFDRWLDLFEQTAHELCSPEAEAHFVEYARRIAASLELGVANANGIMLGVGERLRRPQEEATPRSIDLIPGASRPRPILTPEAAWYRCWSQALS